MFTTIKSRLVALWGVTLVGLVVLGGIGYYTHVVSQEAEHEAQRRFDDLALLDRIDRNLLELTLAAMDSIIDKDEGRIAPDRLMAIQTLSASLVTDSAKILDVVDTDEERKVAASIPKDMATLVGLIGTDLRKAIEGRAGEAEFNRLDDLIDEVGGKVEEAVAFNRESLGKEMAAAWTESDAALNFVYYLGIAAFLVATAVISTFSLLLGRGITLPLSGLTGAMDRLARGDTASPIPGKEADDEIGTMAKAVEVFREGMARAERLQAEQDSLKARAEAGHRGGMGMP